MSKVRHEFQVEMTCEGCSGAVERVLNKLKDKGVSKVDIDLPAQKVYVEAETTLTGELLLESIQKTGKPAKLLGSLPV